MHNKIEINGFRQFEKYSMNELTRVNLLIGSNNCGKTTILEAVELLASEADPLLIERTARRRGEARTGRETPRMQPDISNLFHSHQIRKGASFRVLGDDIKDAGADIRAAGSVETPGFTTEAERAAPFVLRITRPHTTGGQECIPVTKDGRLLTPGRHRAPDRDETRPPTALVTPDALDAECMRAAWDRILTEDRESEVVEIIRLIQPDLKSIAFLTSDTSQAGSDRAGVIVGLDHGLRRLPLGSYGDGMRHLLALSLALVRGELKYLLVDEINTGLHRTVMEGVWHLVVEIARRRAVQVFATTHSLDAVLGLAAFAQAHPGEADEVSIHRMRRHAAKTKRIDVKDIDTSQNVMRR